jgi:RNase adaptor protein for sRNA GlmZ degradation
MNNSSSSQSNLTVAVLSFSFKNPPNWRDYPNGGGFVFDCRAVPNPGREERYRSLTGLDLDVQEYLRALDGFEHFYQATTLLVEQAVAHHLRRGFAQLVVAYGCTGGQHRSVFCATRLAEQLETRVSISLEHRESAHWPVRT